MALTLLRKRLIQRNHFPKKLIALRHTQAGEVLEQASLTAKTGNAEHEHILSQLRIRSLVTKYRNKVLYGAVQTFLNEQTQEICNRYSWEVLALEVMPDHAHLFVSAPPKTAPMVVARTIKSILAVAIFRQFPTLKKKRFRGSGLLSWGTYYGSAGSVSGSTIMKYIAKQKEA